MDDAPNAWVIRAGERGDFVLENGLAGIDFRSVSDLTEATDRDRMRQVIQDSYPDAKDAKRWNIMGQLWSFRNQIKPGDLVALPIKGRSQVAFGVVAKGYEYRHDLDPNMRHWVRVDWRRVDVPRTAIRQDLLRSLGAYKTVYQIKRHDAARRFQQILKTGIDPGARDAVAEPVDGDDPDVLDAVDTSVDIERLGRDQIQQHVAERFAGHRLADLVAAVLDAEASIPR